MSVFEKEMLFIATVLSTNEIPLANRCPPPAMLPQLLTLIDVTEEVEHAIEYRGWDLSPSCRSRFRVIFSVGQAEWVPGKF